MVGFYGGDVTTASVTLANQPTIKWRPGLSHLKATTVALALLVGAIAPPPLAGQTRTREVGTATMPGGTITFEASLERGMSDALVSIYAEQGIRRTLMWVYPAQAAKAAGEIEATIAAPVVPARGESITTRATGLHESDVVFSVERKTSATGDRWVVSFAEDPGLRNVLFLASTMQVKRLANLLRQASAAGIAMQGTAKSKPR